jgi:glucokinase
MRIIGMDLGGTQMRVRLCEVEQQVLAERRIKLTDRSPQSVVNRFILLINELSQEIGDDLSQIVIGCAIAGMLDPQGRVVRNAPNLGWREVAFVQLLESALPQVKHIALYNDLDAAAYGEKIAGAGQDATDLALVFVGSGVGGGLILGNRLHRGSSNVAGEIGHLKVVLDGGRACGCGAYGCVEAYIGGHHLAKIALESAQHSEYLAQRLSELGAEQMSAIDIAHGETLGDPVCRQITNQSATYLAWVISHLVTLVNPAMLVLGGGVLLNWPKLVALTTAQIQLYVSTIAKDGLQIATAQLGDDAGLVGVVALADALMRDGICS